jgi:SNF2 family DNA or RNA helicase
MYRFDKCFIAGSVEVKGADSPEYKEKALLGFAEGNINYLVTKPKIAGFGMNWQNCNNMIFCGLSDSYESYYQAIRRCWRFGQTKPVNAHIIISEKETSVLENIKDKAKRAEQMSKNMIKITSEILKNEIKNTTRQRNTYIPKQEMKLPIWIAG